MKEYEDLTLSPEEYVYYLNKLDLLYIDDDSSIDDILLKWDHFYSLVRIKKESTSTGII